MDFNFSSQHHATIVAENEGATQILFVDNASDDGNRQADTALSSTVKLVALNTSAMEATVSIPRYSSSNGIFHLGGHWC